jgi:hypothetical protein
VKQARYWAGDHCSFVKRKEITCKPMVLDRGRLNGVQLKKISLRQIQMGLSMGRLALVAGAL